MKRVIRTVYTTVGTAIMAVAGAFGVHAAETTEQLSRAARANQMLDTVQAVCLWILILAISLFVVWYVAKAVLKRIHIPPEEKGEQADDQKEDV